MTLNRRTYLRATATATLGTLTIGTATADYTTHQPDHVTLSYDEPTLNKYRPSLDLSTLDVHPTALYGWLATSPEYDTDVAVYWAEYTHQDGVSEYDSHYGDHEPVYVFVNSETGDVEQVVASVYHWMAGKAHASTLSITDNTHVRLRVISPWHHYTASDTDGQLVDLGDLTNVFQSWLDNGLREDLQPGTVVNPWLMESRGYWWKDDIGNFSKNAFTMRILRKLGVHKAGQLG